MDYKNKNYFNRKSRQIKIFAKRILAAAVFIILIFAAFIILLYIPKFKIKKIEIKNGSDSAVNQEVIKIAEKALQKKFLFVIPANNIFALKKSSLIAELASNIFSLKNIKINKDFPNTIYISFEEKAKNIVFCGEPTENRENKECFFSDENGIIFEKLNQGYGLNSDNIVLIENTGIKEPLKERVRIFDEEIFKKIMEFAYKLSELNLKIKKIEIKENSFYLVNSENWTIIIDKKAIAEIGVNNIFENLKLLLSNELKEKRPALERVDLRLKNKIFYKLK